MIIQERAASAKPQSAAIIVSRPFVLSCWREPKSILYAPITIKITAIVAATHIKKSIAFLIARGISLSHTLPDLSLSFDIQSMLSLDA